MPGACIQNGAIYQATVTTEGGKSETYVGMAKNFKKRYYTREKCLLDENSERHTSLTRYYWKMKNQRGNPEIKWKYLERNIPTFNPITRKCRLCLREKYNIVLKPDLATINSRHELFSHCRHMQFELISRTPG